MKDATSSRDSSASRGSDESDNGMECWICYETENETFGGLIQPCACKVGGLW